MKIFHSIPDNKNLFKNAAITMGNFDGVHLGHRKIFNTLKEVAQSHNGDAIVITFSIHPRKVLHPERTLQLLTTTEEKISEIFKLGISNIILLNFTHEMANMHAIDFFNQILIQKLDIKELVIGYDHAFGKDREGDYKFIDHVTHETGVELTRVSEEFIEEKPVSSTWIRTEIEAGNMAHAKKILGRSFSVTGKVIHGHSRGKGLGYPTANIEVGHPEKIIPGDGVYAVIVHLSNPKTGKKVTKKGMMYIGTNPTFHDEERSLEVNILDFDGNLYDMDITIEFEKRIRGDLKFDTKEELVAQIEKDKQEILHTFAE